MLIALRNLRNFLNYLSRHSSFVIREVFLYCCSILSLKDTGNFCVAMLPRFYGEVILCLKILLPVLCVNPIPPLGGGGGLLMPAPTLNSS